jgi:hypothetical protein
MSNCLRLFVVFSICLICSCKDSGGAGEGNHASIIQKGYEIVPYAKLIEKRFDSVSFIANWGNKFSRQEWRTRFFIDDWYECALSQDVDIAGDDITCKGNPALYIFEISHVDGTSTVYSDQRILQGKKLKEFVDSGFDLTSAGFSPKKERPKPPADPMKYWHELYPER